MVVGRGGVVHMQHAQQGQNVEGPLVVSVWLCTGSYNTAMSTALVTTGATEPFRELLVSCASREVLEAFRELGYIHVTVQCGKGLDLFREELAKTQAARDSADNGFPEVHAIAYTPDLPALMRAADLVVSHAGTGSILDALRAQRPLVVVVNSTLMDNHQQDIAEKLSSDGHLLVSGVEPGQLASAIRDSSSRKFTPLPPANSTAFTAIVDREIIRS